MISMPMNIQPVIILISLSTLPFCSVQKEPLLSEKKAQEFSVPYQKEEKALDISLITTLKEVVEEKEDLYSIIFAAKERYNLKKLPKDTRVEFIMTPKPVEELIQINLKLTLLESVEIQKNIDQKWTAALVKKEYEKKVVSFSGYLMDSLWNSAIASEMDPYLIVDFTEIFAWQIDFSREIQIGDQWRLLAVQKIFEGQHVGWGPILLAEYTGINKNYSAMRYEHPKGEYNYFEKDGDSIKKIFLKNPIPYARISSRFQRKRFHPILKRYRPHLGVDYAAPRGTPIRSVGDGTVIVAKRNGGAGKMIKIRHNAIYSTAYKHLHNFAPKIRNGARVKQGQTIGYVGSTGMSTGPHLHYEFYKHGQYVDPLNQKFPSALPIPPEKLAEYKRSLKILYSQLPKWQNEKVKSPLQATKESDHEKTTLR